MEYTFKQHNEAELLREHLNLGGENPSGEAIKVTSRYLERGGKPWMSVMGEYHFSRDDRKNWHRELCKMYAGGIRIVASYLFWIHHEEHEGDLRFDGNLDVGAFVREAADAGLEVVLRVGPWAHGECRNGGLPDWMLSKPYKTRTNDPEYLKEVRRWFGAIANEVRGLFYKDGGPIIAVQLENELTNRAEHLAELKKIALETGLVAPLYTVTGWNSKFGARIPVDEVLPVFGAYPDAPWAGGTNELPLSNHYAFYTMRNDTAIGADVMGGDADGWRLPYERYPFVTCEIGPGMQSTHHRRVVISPIDAYAMSLVKLGCGNNLVGYYMYHGGTNPVGDVTFNETKATKYPNDYPIVNYDFQTCVSQYGEIRGQYRLLNLLHMFINDFGSLLAPLTHDAAEVFANENDTENVRCCLRSDGKQGFLFVNNHQRHAELPERKNVVFKALGTELPPLDIKTDAAFILPVNIELGGCRLKYATAQLLCREDNTFFFAGIPGIKAEFAFEDGEKLEAERVSDSLESADHTKDTGLPNNGNDENADTTAVSDVEILEKAGIRIVVIPSYLACFLRKTRKGLVLGEVADVYEENGEIKCACEGSFAYSIWNGKEFEYKMVTKDFTPCTFEFVPCEPAFNINEKFACELKIENPERKVKWQRISVSSAEGFITVPATDRYDAAQVYVSAPADATGGDINEDGAKWRLVADNYFDGTDWRIPAALVYGHEAYLVQSELLPDCRLEKQFQR